VSAVLLDTHVLVWLLNGERRLSAAAVTAVEQAAHEDKVFVSAITPWEIAMLVARGRLLLTRDVQDWIDDALRQPGVALAPLEPAIAVASTRLPGPIHGDPADRLIVATARHLDVTLVTADDRLLSYGGAGHVRVLNAGGRGLPVADHNGEEAAR
jgi:PIN domain nuclease of toxin-antitoxin system